MAFANAKPISYIHVTARPIILTTPEIPVLVVGGHHAREYAPPDALLTFVRKLLTALLLIWVLTLSLTAIFQKKLMADFKVYATWTHVGDRFGDHANLQTLPAYNTLDLGAVAHFANGIDVRAKKFVVVKNPMNYQQAYTGAAAMYVLDTPGPTTANFASLPWRRGMASTCVGARGFTSRKTMTWSSSYTRSDGISRASSLQKRQFGSWSCAIREG